MSSTALMLAAVVLIVGGFYIVTNALDKSEIFPKDENRYDITNVGIALLADVCPAAAGNHSIEQIGACSGNPAGDLAEYFRPLDIPKVTENFGRQFSSMKTLVSDRGYENISNAFNNKELYVIRFDVPARYFIKNQFGKEPWHLVFGGIQDGRICWEGTCPYSATKHESGGLYFPLYTTRDHNQTSGTIPVWIAAQDSLFPFGMNLVDGLFVTHTVQVSRIRKLYLMALYSKPLFFAAFFIGLYLMSLGNALQWKRYSEFRAFCYLTTSFAVYTVLGNVTLLGNSDALIAGITHGFRSVNLYAALVAFAVSSARLPASAAVGTILFYLVAATSWLMFSGNYEGMQVIASARTLIRFSSVGTMVILAAIFLWNIRDCSQRLLEAGKNGVLSAAIDYRRRITEQVINMIVILTIAGSLHLEHSATPSMRSDFLIHWVGLMLFCLYATMTFFTTSKLAKTHFRKDGVSEAVRLQGRLPVHKFTRWLAQDRSGLLVQIDLKNSTIATNKLRSQMHILMRDLHDAIYRSHSSQGFKWILSKKNGDEWIFLIDSKSGSLAKDLQEIIDITRVSSAGWIRLVKAQAPGCDLHINISALTSYTLRAPGQDQDSATVHKNAALETSDINTWDYIDFVSHEANYFMKWGGKSPLPNTITVGCSREIYEQIRVPDQFSPISGLIAEENGADKALAAQAASMDLGLVYVPLNKNDRISIVPKAS